MKKHTLNASKLLISFIILTFLALPFISISHKINNSLISQYPNQTVNVSNQSSTPSFVQSNLNENTNYLYIESPHLISGSDQDFYVCDAINDIYHFNQDTLRLETQAYHNLVDIDTYANILYILTPDKLIKYNTLSNPINQTEIFTKNSMDSNFSLICADSIGFVIASEYSVNFLNPDTSINIPITTHIRNHAEEDLGHIKAIELYQNKIYVIHSTPIAVFKSEYSIQIPDNTHPNYSIQCTNSSELSTAINSHFEIKMMNSTLVIALEDQMYLTNSAINQTSPSILQTVLTPIGFTQGQVKRLTSFDIYQDKIIICDENPQSNSIQSFRLTENQELIFDKLLVASSGADSDRLYLPSDLSLSNHTPSQYFLYIADFGNNRIQRKDLTTGENSKSIDISSPKQIEMSTLGQIYITTSNAIQYYETEDTTSPTIIDITDFKICSSKATCKNEFYSLDAKNNLLLRYNKSINSLDTILTFNDLDILDNSKLLASVSGNTLFLLSDNSIYSIHLDNKNTNHDKILQISDKNIVDFDIDYKNNLFCLLEKDGEYSIVQYSSNILTKTLDLGFGNYNSLTLDVINGVFYSIDNKYNKIIKIKTSNFVNSLEFYENNNDFRQNPALTGANIARVTQNTQTFLYPFNISPSLKLDKDDLVIVLKYQTEENHNFAYIMVSNKQDKNMLVYIENLYLEEVQDTPLDFEEITVTANHTTYLYYLPTGLDFEDNRNCALENQIVSRYQKFRVIGNACGYKDFENMSYYTVQLQNGEIAYIKQRYAQNSDTLVVSLTIQPNAKVQKILQSDRIYIYEYDSESNQYIKTLTELKDNQEIELVEKFDTNNEYLLIKYINDQNVLVQGYVPTKYIIYNDITLLKTVGFCLLAVCAILAIIAGTIIAKFVKNKKIRKIENEN